MEEDLSTGNRRKRTRSKVKGSGMERDPKLKQYMATGTTVVLDSPAHRLVGVKSSNVCETGYLDMVITTTNPPPPFI